MIAIVGVDTKLINHFKFIFAPVFDVDQGILQRRTIFALEGITFAQGFGGGEDIGIDDFIAKTGKFRIG
ncbi:hypothetical protein BMETH_1311_0 [methanotrophic bacterial endosymbiont of Bathymodiolus sp.]|nr:hypothetical protein BMETH_1311_0 [methanotrophic bacterial endosymbiont of Bathymodiolus sp.]